MPTGSMTARDISASDGSGSPPTVRTPETTGSCADREGSVRTARRRCVRSTCRGDVGNRGAGVHRSSRNRVALRDLLRRRCRGEARCSRSEESQWPRAACLAGSTTRTRQRPRSRRWSTGGQEPRTTSSMTNPRRGRRFSPRWPRPMALRGNGICRGGLCGWPRHASHRLRFDASMRVSNAKAKAELGWSPKYPSYREGIAVSAD